MTTDKQTMQLIIDSIDNLRTQMEENNKEQRQSHDEVLKLEMRIQGILNSCNTESVGRINKIKEDLTTTIRKVEKELGERIGLVRDEIFTDLSTNEEKQTARWHDNDTGLKLLKQKVVLVASGAVTLIGIVFTIINVLIKFKS